MKTSPTHRTYTSLDAAYDYFNKILFDGELPSCLITVQRHRGALGYYSSERFVALDSGDVTDEIALNPSHFRSRSLTQTLSTLVHEMCHLWQQHLGEPPRRCYHDKEWSKKMEEIGLIPSATGEPGGKKTGQNMTHYIEDGGRFAVACAAYLQKNGAALYSDRAGEEGDDEKPKKMSTRVKYTCPGCALNAWAKPDVVLICGDCQEEMEAEEVD